MGRESGSQTAAPEVSVVLAAYNHEEFVAEAVTTVLNQSGPSIELIVVDDGSSDGTADVVAGFDDPRLRLVRLEHNRAHHPRNLAIGLARGEYVAFQNSDDAWSEGKLAAQVAFLSERPEYVACFSGASTIGADGAPGHARWTEGMFTTRNRTSTRWLRDFFFCRGGTVPIASAVVRREALQRSGLFRPSLTQLSDLDMWIRLATIGELHIIEEPLTQVRVVKGRNLSRPLETTRARANLEMADVLARYTQPQLLQRFVDIFPEWSQFTTPGAQKVALALCGLGKKGAMGLFADRTLAAVLDDPTEREQALATHGHQFIHDFLRTRGEMVLRPRKKTWLRTLRNKLRYG